VISWNICVPEKVGSRSLMLRHYAIEAVHFRNQKQRRLRVDSLEADNTGVEETNAGRWFEELGTGGVGWGGDVSGREPISNW
jgi:hypothetical protein